MKGGHGGSIVSSVSVADEKQMNGQSCSINASEENATWEFFMGLAELTEHKPFPTGTQMHTLTLLLLT